MNTHNVSSKRRKGVSRLKRLVRLNLLTPSRRRFLVQGIAFMGAGVLAAVHRALGSRPHAYLGQAPIRPPGAVGRDRLFQQRCVRCGLCGLVCESGCIRFFGSNESENGRFTPYIDVRRRSCTLCMDCTNICPTGALRPIQSDLDSVAREVRMGVAQVDPELCISYLGRLCGYCHDACPLPNHAIRLMPPAKPVIIEEGCVGCGRCVEYCPQNPTAIRVLPASRSHVVNTQPS